MKSPRTIAQTNAFWYILLEPDFLHLSRNSLFAFFIEYNGILGVLEHFGPNHERDRRRLSRPSRPRPSRRKFASRGRAAAPPHSNKSQCRLSSRRLYFFAVFPVPLFYDIFCQSLSFSINSRCISF